VVVVASAQHKYDVNLISATGKKIESKKKITGKELKEYRSSLKGVLDNCKLQIYKTSTNLNGKLITKLYKTECLGINKAVKSVFENMNFHYHGVNVDYNISYSCESVECDSICRCAKFESLRIESIDLNEVVLSLTGDILKVIKPFKLNIDEEILVYCLDRLIRHSGLRNPDNYDINCRSGYYGEELDGVSYYDDDLINNIVNIIQASSIGAIKIVLEKEYGYLLPTIKDFNLCLIKQVKPLQLVMPNKEYYFKLDKEMVEEYGEYNLPIGIYIDEDDGHYRLIDGCHRYHAFIGSGSKVCKIIILK
jgi:hypothetical protein